MFVIYFSASLLKSQVGILKKIFLIFEHDFLPMPPDGGTLLVFGTLKSRKALWIGYRGNSCEKAFDVKSGKRFSSNSLDKFCVKYNEFVNTSIILHSGDLQIKDNATFLSVYITLLL